MDDAYARLNDLAAKAPVEKKAPGQEAAERKAKKPADEKPADAPDNPPGDDAPEPESRIEGKGPDVKKPDAPKTGPRQLAAAYEQVKKEKAALEKELADERKKIIDHKTHPEFVKMTEAMKKLEKQRDDYESELRYADYTKSSEYKDKYHAPFVEAYEEGQKWAAQLQVNDANGESRKATAEDFDEVVRAYSQNPMEGIRLIQERFGDQAAGVIYHMKEIQKLNSARVRAIEDYKKNGSEREKQRTEQRQKFNEEMHSTYNKEVQSGIERFPQWFKAKDGDEEGAKILTHGFELADAAFGAKLKDADGKEIELSPQRKVALHAAIRNKAGAFDHAVHLLNKSEALVKELQAKLAEYEASEPGEGQGRGGKPPTDPRGLMDRVEAELRKRTGT